VSAQSSKMAKLSSMKKTAICPIHGTADADVPYKESVKMNEKLSQFKVQHEFLRVPGGSHCLEDDAPAVRTLVFRQAMDFVRAQMS
jgi:dipeptidyl aminopeptidase/acylaminoacyl peptidase